MPTRSIPQEIKRNVRQKCGFGCVICGMPLFHYDHIEEYSIVQTHNVENITLLCPNHHQDKTSGRITPKVILNATLSPFNLQNNYTAPHQIILSNSIACLEVGGNIYEFDFGSLGNQFDAIEIKGKRIVGISWENDYLLLNIIMTDQQGNVILEIEKGEMKISTRVWDFKMEGTKIQINEAIGEIQFKANFLPNGLNITKGLFSTQELSLIIEPDFHTLMPMNLRMSGNRVTNCRKGLVVN